MHSHLVDGDAHSNAMKVLQISPPHDVVERARKFEANAARHAVFSAALKDLSIFDA